jgi:hypothetical protein
MILLFSNCNAACSIKAYLITIGSFSVFNVNTQNAARLLVELYRTDGFLQLWRGNWATVLRVMPYAGVQFSAHDKFKRLFLKKGEKYV